MSGDLFKEISTIALNIDATSMNSTLTPISIDIEQINNNYVIELVTKVLDLESQLFQMLVFVQVDTRLSKCFV